jgi:hypothetical protein
MLAATSRGRQNLWDATGLSRGGSRILLTCLGLVNKERETPPRKAVASLSPAVLAGSSQHETPPDKPVVSPTFSHNLFSWVI